jgi:hypothetical protein
MPFSLRLHGEPVSQNGDKPHCQAKTKAGKACKGTPIGATDFEFCVAHAPAEVRESLGFVADNGKGGRPKNPRAVDVLRERIENRIDEVIDPLFEALKAEAGVALNIKGGGMFVEMIPDHPTRIKAVRELLDRGYGRPRQLTEITGADGGPIRHEELTPQDGELHLEAARVIAEAERATASAANGQG